MREPATVPGIRPAYLVVQGRLLPGAESLYADYLAGTRPLLAKYGAEVAVVGEGVSSAHTTETWPVNALLRFPSVAAAEGFLGDPDYLEIKTRYRDRAYQVLHLSLLLGRPPRGPAPTGDRP
jgi:uncharacterized protein (DUF1330 family)